jgi:uncharacterized protein (TIGR00369 family)
MTASRISPEDFKEALREGMPTWAALPLEILTLEHGSAVLRLATTAADLRPGGTVAGPVLFGLADLAMFAAVMSVAGKVPLAVTTDATVHFLRRPRAGALVGRARVLKAGARLVVGEVTIALADAEDDVVAHAVMTYSVPPESRAPVG